MEVVTQSPATTDESVVQRKQYWILLAGAVFVASAAALYLSLFWNHFVGLRSGAGEYFSGVLFTAKGYLPYRDYFIPSPPFNNLKSALWVSLFGKQYIAIRALGSLERILLGVIVYFWLARLFRASHAALAAIVTIVLSTGDTSDPIASYNHDAILFAVLSAFLGSYVLDKGRSHFSVAGFALAAGASSALSCSVKQTTGLGITFAVPVVIGLCLVRFEDVRKALLFLLTFAAGWAAATGALLLWLARIGALWTFFEDVFVRGPGAKASSPLDFFRHEMMMGRQLLWAVLLGVVGIAFCWKLWVRSARHDAETDRVASVRGVALLGSVALVAISLGYLASLLQFRYARVVLKPTVYFTFIGTFLLALSYGFRYISGRLTRREAQFWLYASAGFAVAFMLSLSFPAFEAMMVPGLGLLAAATFDALRGRLLPFASAVAISATLLAGETCAKLDLPFAFAPFGEPPVRAATAKSSIPDMAGFVLPPKIVNFIDGTVRIINENTGPNDTVYSFPELIYFNGITARLCPTLSCSHNMDVVSDEFASKEAVRLLANPPGVLIYWPNPELLPFEESFWRNGRPSGQRDLVAAIDSLIPHYRLAGSFDVVPNAFPVRVYVREPVRIGSVLP